MKILILAGGCGKRLWPLSTERFPKQFVHLGDHESLLRKTVKRFFKKGLIKNVFIVTNKEYASFVLEDLQDMDLDFEQRIIIEPYSKNTAPAVTWAIRVLLSMKIAKEDEAIFTVPIDHVFLDENKAISSILDAQQLLERDSIITFGVKCVKPDTGYGYIKTGAMLLEEYCKVEIFIEKPEIKLAERLFKEGGWLWNIGIFLFHIKTYLEELKATENVLYHACDPKRVNSLSEYKKLSSISVDHAVIEKFKNIRVVELVDIGWSDIGSWNSLYDFLQEDENGRVRLGNIANSDTKKYFLLEQDKRALKALNCNISIIEEERGLVILKEPLS